MIAGWIFVLACLVYCVGPAVIRAVRPPRGQERRPTPLQAPMVRELPRRPYDWAREVER